MTGGQTTLSWNAPALLEWENLFTDAHCHVETLHRMFVFHAFYWVALSNLFFLVFCNTHVKLLWPLADNICLNFFGLFGECVCASTASTTLWLHHSQMKPRFHHLLLIRCNWEIHHHLHGISVKLSNLRQFSAFYVHPWPFLEPILLKTCDSVA
jgi:hypothetical protein